MQTMTDYIRFNEEIEQTHKMLDETNDNNIEGLKQLIPHFYLDYPSERAVLNAIDEPPIHPFFSRELNRHNRLFIPVKPNKHTDKGWGRYSREIMSVDFEVDWDLRVALDDYDVWSSGMIDGMKLFKFLRRNGMNQETLEELTTCRNTSDQYLVVSKNPVDFLFMSTNHSFSSCMGLGSNYDGAFYMGLPEFMVDPHKFIVFLTTGKLKKYTTKDILFKHFGYINRSLAIFTNQNELGLVRYYPNETMGYRDTLRKAGIGSRYYYNRRNLKRSDEWFSHYWPAQPKLYFDDGHRCQPYRDHGVAHTNHRNLVYSSFGSAGSTMNCNWTGGFESLQSLDDLFRSGTTCGECGGRADEDELTWIDDCSYCDGCRHDRLSFCEVCDEYVHNDYAIWSESMGCDICENCRDNSSSIFFCEECDEWYWEYDMSRLHDGTSICDRCADSYTFVCPECEERYHEDDKHGLVCEDCSNTLEDEKEDLQSEINTRASRIGEINVLIDELINA